MATRTQKLNPPRLCLGEYAKCHCCDDVLPIRMVGLDRDVAGQVWTASPALVAAVYQDLSLPDTLQRRQANCYLCARRVSEYKHYWVHPDPSDKDCRFLYGPFCVKCVPSQAMLMEDKSGASVPPVAYEVVFSIKLANQLKKTLPANTRSLDEEAWDDACDQDGSFPLF